MLLEKLDKWQKHVKLITKSYKQYRLSESIEKT